MRRLLPYLFALACFLVGGRLLWQQVQPAPITDLAPTVILVSMDGFRWDYVDRYEAPNLRRLAAGGVRAERLLPVFPTVTFPNHYSIITGRYPKNHGIVNNTMYDRVWDDWFSLGDRRVHKEARWWEGEPLWVTAERQGQRAATCFWPGSEAPIQGIRPSYVRPYKGNLASGKRVDQILEWLDLPATERPTLLTLYFSQTDEVGEDFGPDSPEIAQAVASVDAAIGQLLRGLRARKVDQQVHLLVVSDHGMTAMPPRQFIYLEDYLDLDDVRVVNAGPPLMLEPNPGRTEAVLEALQHAHPHLRVYRRDKAPAHWQWGEHRRQTEIVGVADPGWQIRKHRRDQPHRGRGLHGFDNAFPDMHAVFIGHGPSFRRGAVVPPFENVHLYPLMAHLLGLQPAETDGSLEAVAQVLARP